MSSHTLWRTILAAWTHDPAEKAIILMRGKSHEAGTVWALQQRIFGSGGIPTDLKRWVKQGDHWASAADRPQFGGGGRDSWAQVRFDQNPELIHPLSGERIDQIQGFDIGVDQIEAVSLGHFSGLIHGTGEAVDFRKSALAFWRFGPEPPAPELGELWTQMPADTRIPDHSIWAHLDLTSAFAAAFAGDAAGRPALLQMTFGPVQDFIAQARTTSDLWAGSHLLSRIAWEGIRVICERLGPGAILFPQLRGIPQVDLWLLEQGVDPGLFESVAWKKGSTDANPLFAAALPNKFMALVPESMADELAASVEETVREWVLEQGRATVDLLFDKAKAQLAVGQDVALDQLEQQLQGFPEVHWSVVPWQNEEQGNETLAAFYPEGVEEPGFLGSKAWTVLKQGGEFDDLTLFKPNEGMLYPVNYELADRTLAAVKTVRPFSQLRQEGYRCSLCGEREWLTHDRALLDHYPGRGDRLNGSLWSMIGNEQKSWARKGEHLCGICAIKRLWPTRFAEEVEVAIGKPIHRFVVSTHTMALVNSLNRWRQQPDRKDFPMNWQSQLEGVDTVALPKGLASRLKNEPRRVRQVIRKLPALIQHYQDSDEPSESLVSEMRRLFGHKPETYYALILMDGDSMGAWLSGEGSQGLCYEDAFHSKVEAGLRTRRKNNGDLERYLTTRRAVSPARHIAISTALNSFAVEVVPWVVEEIFKGKLLYAGGDDVLAMVSVDDLLPCLTLLRYVWSGSAPSDEAWRWLQSQGKSSAKIANGHLYLQGRLHRMMGRTATASAGAVIAHHQAPLGKVLTELRGAEKRAKNSGRDAFSISIMRRSGGRSDFTGKWQLDHAEAGFESSPMGLLLRTREALSDESLSRRAAYILQDWLRQMPEQPEIELLTETMGYQFGRQGGDAKVFRELGKALVVQGNRLCQEGLLEPQALKGYLSELLGVAEFLAREGRGENGHD